MVFDRIQLGKNGGLKIILLGMAVWMLVCGFSFHLKNTARYMDEGHKTTKRTATALVSATTGSQLQNITTATVTTTSPAVDDGSLRKAVPKPGDDENAQEDKDVEGGVFRNQNGTRDDDPAPAPQEEQEQLQMEHKQITIMPLNSDGSATSDAPILNKTEPNVSLNNDPSGNVGANPPSANTTMTKIVKRGGGGPRPLKFRFLGDIYSGRLSDDVLLRPYCDVKKDDWCVAPKPIEGKWILRDQPDGTQHKHIVDVCCSNNPKFLTASPPECRASSIPRKYRDWVYPKIGVPVPFHTRDTIISCRDSWNGTHKDPYVWQSSLYNLTVKENFSPEKVCKHVGKRKVLLIGDSTMKQFASTLSNALLPLDYKDGGKNSCRKQITSGVVDTLIGVAYGHKKRGDHFVKIIDRFKPDIAILATGAHINGEENYKHVIDEVLESIKTLQAKYPNLKFVWKTISPFGCTDLINLRPYIEKGYAPDDMGRRTKYDRNNWDSFYGRDLYTIARMQRHGIPVMDMRMLYSRTDVHIDNPRDCMHIVSPGPYDVAPMIFQHLLENGL